MTFVIGDIHGEITKLKKLLTYIYNIDQNSTLIFVGDYINKGENSKEVLDYLQTLKNSIFLIGNHEYYFLEYLKNGSYKDKLLKYGLNSTFEDFDMNFEQINEKLYIKYKSFFDNLKPYYETEKYFISHAGVGTDYIKQSPLNIPIKEFILNNRYDFIKSNDKINGKISIFGHTGFVYPYIDSVKIGIDTSAVYHRDNPLSSFCIDEEYFLTHYNEKKYLSEYNKNICPVIIRKEPYRNED